MALAETIGSSLPKGYSPSEDEEFMSLHQRAYFRQRLLDWKREIVEGSRKTIANLRKDSGTHPDLTDRASFEADRTLELRARDRQRKLASKINTALLRVEDGSYGYCTETGEPIALARLKARPIAMLSIEAQERHEQKERIRK